MWQRVALQRVTLAPLWRVDRRRCDTDGLGLNLTHPSHTVGPKPSLSCSGPVSDRPGPARAGPASQLDSDTSSRPGSRRWVPESVPARNCPAPAPART